MHRLDVLGPPRLTRPDGSPADLALGKPFAVLVFLSLTDTAPTRKELARLFWPGSEARNARQSVRQTLSILRRALDPELFETDDPVKLRTGEIETDVARLRVAVEESDVESAEALWRGRLMEEFALPDAPEWTRWVETRELALESALVHLLATDAEVLRQRGEVEPAITRLEKAIGIDPYREGLHSALVDLHLESGRLTKAVHAIGQARELLGSDTPAVAHMTERMERRVRRNDVSASGATRAAAAELRTELVGRTREMAVLLDAWRRSESGTPRVAVLTGPAGIGKTRLTEELADAVRADGASVIRLTAERNERGLEWGLIAELARKLARLPGADSLDRSAAAALKRLSPAIPMGPEPDNAELEPAPVAGSVTSLLMSVAAEQPLLLVIDEAQWADECSRAVLSRLARSLDTARCAVIVCLQDEETDDGGLDFIEALGHADGAVRVRLDALSDGDVREMVALMVDLPEQNAQVFRERLAGAADGNPLYLTELLRALVEEGTLVAGPEGLRLSGERVPDPLPLPSTVHEILHRRLSLLSDPAVAFAAHLARLGGKASLEDVRERSSLSEGALARAAGELMSCRVLEWSDPEIVSFSHDRLRRAVLDKFPVGSNGKGRRWWQNRLVAGISVVTFLLLAVIGLSSVLTPDPTDPAPFGGGLLLVYSQDSETYVMDPRSGPPSEWSHERARFWYPRAVERTGPFRLASGDTVWYVRGYGPDSPPTIVEAREDGTRTEIVRMQGDVNLPWVSPGGRFMTYVAQNTEVEKYHQDLWVSRTDGSDARKIMRYQGQIGNPKWSPNGKFIATQVIGEVATILVLSPLGERVAVSTADRISRPAWCGGTDTLVAIVQRGPDRSFMVMDVGDATVDHIPAPGVLFSEISCSPDGLGLVYDRAVDGRPTPVLYDLQTAELHVLPEISRAQQSRRWLPDPGIVVPVAARLDSHGVDIPWGESDVLALSVVMSDSSRGSEAARWTSSSPDVASVSSEGRVSGNLPGTAWIRATVHGWMTDSARVTVTQGHPSRLLLHDRFEVLDSVTWIPVGYPIPRQVTLADGPALSFEGDGVYKDGIVSRRAFDLGSGATLELSFRLPLTTDRQQRLGVSLFDGDPLPGGEANFPGGWRRRAILGFVYPATEEIRFNPTEMNASFGTGENQSIFLPDVLPTDDWVHAAFQVRPDGFLQLFVNHELVATSDLRVELGPEQRYRISLTGAAVGTELLVRNVSLWEGVRY